MTLPAVVAIRVIVVHRLPKEEHNAMPHLFSAREEALRYANDHYRRWSPETSTLLLELFQAYREDSAMATQLEEFAREAIDRMLKRLPLEKRLEGLSAAERLTGLSPQDVLAAMSPEAKRAALDALRHELGQNGSAPENN